MRTPHIRHFAMLVSVSMVLLYNCTSTKTNTNTHISAINGKKESPYVLSQDSAPATPKKRVYQDTPYSLIVEALPEFDISLLENKEGIEVRNTLILQNILYIDIEVHAHTTRAWITQLDNVLGVTENPVRTID